MERESSSAGSRFSGRIVVDPMIIEGLLTTSNADGSPHIAPMGPVVDESLSQWQLRPFQSSETFANLQLEGICVFHVVDDVLPLVQTALSLPTDLQCSKSELGGWVIDSACHWYCLETVAWDLSQARSQASMRLVGSRVLRPFWGWNRAKHACIEATILATRIHLTSRAHVLSELERLESAVQKTGGSQELAAWKCIDTFVRSVEE